MFRVRKLTVPPRASDFKQNYRKDLLFMTLPRHLNAGGLIYKYTT